MKRKLNSHLPASMIFSCILLYLCTACANQATVLPDALSNARISEHPDITSIFNRQDTDSSQNARIIKYTRRTSPVALTFYTEEQSSKTENNTLLYTNKCVYPFVTIEGNENAADKINADIQTRVAAFYADTSLSELAKNDYQDYYAPENYYFPAYFDKLIFTATRADSNVISFLVTTECYLGGAHGMDTYTGLNYDTQTGNLINFAELSKNSDTFYQNTLTFHQSLAAATAYQSIMWVDDSSWKNENGLEQILYQDGRWYLSTTGLVFFSNPYELGAFYAGKIEFTIPYSDLEEMGFNEKYNYEGTKTIPLQTEEVCSLDLNGDEWEEDIQFYIDNPGSADTNLHFIINGTDYASEHKELSEQFSNDDYIFCWTKCFLYDMDTDDDTVEIAFQMNYSNWEEGIIMPYTFLYRYEKDGSLIYLGRMEGTITDPTIIFSP